MRALDFAANTPITNKIHRSLIRYPSLKCECSSPACYTHYSFIRK